MQNRDGKLWKEKEQQIIFSVFHSVNKYIKFFFFSTNYDSISSRFLVEFIFIQVFSGINIYFLCGLWTVLCFSLMFFISFSSTTDIIRKHCMHNKKKSARARKSSDDPNNVTNKHCFKCWNIHSRRRGFKRLSSALLVVGFDRRI